MALERLGRRDEAANYYRELQQIAADPRWKEDPEVGTFLREAKEVLGSVPSFPAR